MFLKKAVYDNRKWGSEEKDNQQGNGIEADEFLLVSPGIICGAGPLFVKQQPGQTVANGTAKGIHDQIIHIGSPGAEHLDELDL